MWFINLVRASSKAEQDTKRGYKKLYTLPIQRWDIYQGYTQLKISQYPSKILLFISPPNPQNTTKTNKPQATYFMKDKKENNRIDHEKKIWKNFK